MTDLLLLYTIVLFQTYVWGILATLECMFHLQVLLWAATTTDWLLHLLPINDRGCILPPTTNTTSLHWHFSHCPLQFIKNRDECLFFFPDVMKVPRGSRCCGRLPRAPLSLLSRERWGALQDSLLPELLWLWWWWCFLTPCGSSEEEEGKPCCSCRLLFLAQKKDVWLCCHCWLPLVGRHKCPQILLHFHYY